MKDYTLLTDQEKQEIVNEYNRKYNMATVMQISSILSVLPVLLIKDYFSIPHNVMLGITTVFAFLFLSTSAYRYSLMNCPICGRNFGYRKHKPAQCPFCNTHLGSIWDMLEPE